MTRIFDLTVWTVALTWALVGVVHFTGTIA